MGESPFAVRVASRDDHVDVHVEGDVDLATRGAFLEALTAACRLGPPVHVDLGEVGFLDPQGAALLGRLQADNGHVVVVDASVPVRRIIAIMAGIEHAPAVPVIPSAPTCEALDG